MFKSLLGVLILVTFSTAFAKSRNCREGDLVTLTSPFQGVVRGSVIKKFEPGSIFRLGKIEAFNGKYIVQMTEVEGTGVDPILNPRTGDIIGCSVLTRNIDSTRVCVGNPGYCFASYDPRRLIFRECALIP
jgi:hypothetical protein